MPTFEPALRLNEGFYRDAVAPLLDGIPHAAARIDAGLPETYRGWPVRYGWDAVPVMHHVWVTTVRDYSTKQLGFDATAGVDTIDWLLMPQQSLLEVTRGAVYHDDTGELTALRERLAYYPDDVWLWLVACQWVRISQEEAFVGRTAEVGDELGSQIVAARVARDLVRLWFLFERTYAPYSKWLGSAFKQLPGGDALGAALRDALAARDYTSCEAALVMAYEIAARRHNELGITEPLDPTVRPFYGRPFLTLMSDRLAKACLAQLGESPLTRLPLVGGVDFADSVDLLSKGDRPRLLRALYELSGIS